MFRRSIPRAILVAATIVVILPLFSSSADAKHTKRHSFRPWHGYGFLPGYRTPEQIERERARARGPEYWYGSPRFYRGRWNGGGFGPCWTQTPIGNMWNCGK
jgi:hypothetical protein